VQPATEPAAPEATEADTVEVRVCGHYEPGKPPVEYVMVLERNVKAD
jgi:hypothetical protein